MGVTAGDTLTVIIVIIVVGKMHISGYEPRGDSKRAHRRDHEHRQVATAPAPELQGPDRILGTLLVPRHVFEGPSDDLRHVDEKLVGVGRSVLAEETGGPAIDTRPAILKFESYHAALSSL